MYGRIKNKVPGLDGTLDKAFKQVVKTKPDLFVNTFEECLKEGIFLLWNIMSNRVLVLPFPEKTMIVGFTEYSATVVSAKHAEDVEVYVTETVRAAKFWKGLA